jgi:putative MFS transporter
MNGIAQRIDRLPSTPMLRKVLFLTGIGWMFDAMDQGMVSGVMAAIGKDWALGTDQLGLLGSAGMLGMGLGAAISGMAADKWGRRNVILATLVLYGIASGLSGFATSFPMLLALRFLTGFGLGGELPAASTLVSEWSPTRIRGRNVIFLESFWAWGWILAALVAYLLIPVYGWRIAFWIGAVPALFAAILRAAVPESPRWLESKGRTMEADSLLRVMEKQAGMESPASPENSAATTAHRITFLDLWSKKYLLSTIVLWAIWFGINFGYYGFVLWTPSLLVAKGFALVKSFEFTLIMCLAQLPGYFSAAWLVERIGRKKVLAVYFAGTAIAAWLFGHADTTATVLAAGSLLYFFSLGAWGCVYAYTPEVYPTEARASGTGWASAFGRIGAFIAPLTVPVMYKAFGEQTGFGAVFAVLTGVFAVVAVIVVVFGKETKGRSLEQING